jgi:hypothetical protein
MLHLEPLSGLQAATGNGVHLTLRARQSCQETFGATASLYTSNVGALPLPENCIAGMRASARQVIIQPVRTEGTVISRWLILVAAAGALISPQAQPLPSAGQLWDSMIAAKGGRERLNSVQAFVLSASEGGAFVSATKGPQRHEFVVVLPDRCWIGVTIGPARWASAFRRSTFKGRVVAHDQWRASATRAPRSRAAGEIIT